MQAAPQRHTAFWSSACSHHNILPELHINPSTFRFPCLSLSVCGSSTPTSINMASLAAPSCSAVATSARRPTSFYRPCPALSQSRCSSARRSTAVLVQAAAKPPAGVTMPPKQPDVPPPTFGFVHFAEKINGRAAMMGFFALLALEGIANKGILELVGLQVGKGLGFEL